MLKWMRQMCVPRLVYCVLVIDWLSFHCWRVSSSSSVDSQLLSWTAVYIAAVEGWPSIVAEMISRGANVNVAAVRRVHVACYRVLGLQPTVADLCARVLLPFGVAGLWCDGAVYICSIWKRSFGPHAVGCWGGHQLWGTPGHASSLWHWLLARVLLRWLPTAHRWGGQ